MKSINLSCVACCVFSEERIMAIKLIILVNVWHKVLPHVLSTCRLSSFQSLQVWNRVPDFQAFIKRHTCLLFTDLQGLHRVWLLTKIPPCSLSWIFCWLELLLYQSLLLLCKSVQSIIVTPVRQPIQQLENPTKREPAYNFSVMTTEGIQEAILCAR